MPLREGAHPDALTIDPDNDACTPAAAQVAQPVMDAMGRIAAAAERAKSGGRYPAALRDGTATVRGVTLAYTPYDDGARFVVSATATMPTGAAIINCARLSVAQPDDREKFHVYAPAVQSGFFIAYSPALGIYLVPPAQAGRGATMVRASTEPVPSAPPAAPFALRAAPACPSGTKPAADAVVAAVRAARDAQRAGAPIPSAEIAEIVAGGTGSTGWLEIKPADTIAQVAIVQCLHVAAVPSAQLKSAGIGDARRPGAIGFSDRFGFYLIARPPDSSTPAPSAPQRSVSP
jgi:hypothetical protein